MHKKSDKIKKEIQESREALAQPDNPGRAFFESIGIDPNTAIHAGLGHLNLKDEMIVIPLTEKSFEIFLLNGDKKPWKTRGESHSIGWNTGILFEPGIHFITSGVFDSLAVMECGYTACTMRGSFYINKFLVSLDSAEWKPREDAVLVVALAPGEAEAAQRLADGLEARGAKVLITNLGGESRRVFEEHHRDAEEFCAHVHKAAEEAAALCPDVLTAQPLDELPPVNPYVLKEAVVQPSRTSFNGKNVRGRAQHALKKAGDDVRTRFETKGISRRAAVAAGLGYIPELRTKYGKGSLPVMIPYDNFRNEIVDWNKPVPKKKEAWRSWILDTPGIIFIAWSVDDALVAIENGQKAMAVGEVPRFLRNLKKEKVKLSDQAAFVLIPPSGEQAQKDSDAILKFFKRKNAIVTRAAAFRGTSEDVITEFRKNPQQTKKYFDAAVAKVGKVLEKRVGAAGSAEAAEAKE